MRLSTPMGEVWAQINSDGAVTQFGFGAGESSGYSTEVELQIQEYFAGVRHSFVLPLALQGTAFQLRAWEELQKVSYGTTITYSELGDRAGKPNAPRAAARANATNPIALIVPCHRVISSSGGVTGYRYGVELKKQLLEFERRTKEASRGAF